MIVTIYSLIEMDSLQDECANLNKENLILKNRIDALSNSLKLNGADSLNINKTDWKNKTNFNTKKDELLQYQQELLKYQKYIPDRYPIKKVIISRGFLPEQNHLAYDLAGSRGDTIFAAGSGLVETIQENHEVFGVCLLIDHLNGFKTFYGHNQNIFVKIGDLVDKGKPIATIGMSGQTTAPHLHFELRYNQKNIDPAKLLK